MCPSSKYSTSTTFNAEKMKVRSELLAQIKPVGALPWPLEDQLVTTCTQPESVQQILIYGFYFEHIFSLAVRVG